MLADSHNGCRMLPQVRLVFLANEQNPSFGSNGIVMLSFVRRPATHRTPHGH